MSNCFISKLRLKFRPLIVQSIRSRTFWPIPPNLKDIEMPPEKERLLIQLEASPNWHGVRARKYPRQMVDIRGPELVNNQLLYKQFGIIAVTGVHLTIDHINLIRTVINKHMNTSRMFAVWRIEPPWKPIVKKSMGKRMGGGKASIHHYATPIRAGQVIVEVGGQIVFDDCYYFLESIAKRLPCDAFPVSQQILDNWEREQKRLNELNINPYSFERVIKQNMQGCHKWLSPYEKLWFGKYY